MSKVLSPDEFLARFQERGALSEVCEELSVVKFVRVVEGYKNRDNGRPNKRTVETGGLKTGQRVDTDEGYTVLVRVGDVYLEIFTSEWGHVKVIDKEEADQLIAVAIAAK